MARQNHGPLSRAKGKLGGVVYQQYEGMQISREYQPVVKNPQTEKQTENRAKFKTASQIVAQFSEVFNVRLAKISTYIRKRRGTALSAIYGAVEIDAPSADAIFEDVINSVNAKSMSSIDAPTLGSGTGDTRTITATTGDVVSYIFANYDSDGKLMNRESATYTSDGTAKSVTPSAGAKSYGIMVVAVRATTEAGRATLSNISSNGDGYSLTIARAVAAGDVEISNIIGEMSMLD